MLSTPTAALDEQRLWLPIRYQSLYLSLIKAAQVAEALDRCETVIEGTVDLEESQPNRAIYRILCRQSNGRTYNEMVDGVTFVTLVTPLVVKPEPTPEEKRLLLQQEEEKHLAEIARRTADAWEVCRRELLDSTQLMMSLQWLVSLEEVQQPVELGDDHAYFRVDFDARSMWSEPLHFTAECQFAGGLATVKLSKR